MSLEKLYRILQRNPLEANRVIAVFKGRPVTLREAISILERGGKEAEELQAYLVRLGIDPEEVPEEWWELAYQRYLQKPENYVLFYKGRKWTKKDILEEIKKRSPIGKEFVLMELEYLQELMK